MSTKYSPKAWTDRNVTTPTDYVATKSGGGALSSGDTLTMTASPGVTTDAGTPIQAQFMNELEKGAQKANNSERYYNLLSDTIARCEDNTDRTNTSTTDALDTANQFEGKSCIEMTLSAATGSMYYDAFSLITTTKYYLFSAYVRNNDLSGSGVRLNANAVGGGGNNYSSYSTSTDWTRLGVIISATDLTSSTALRLTVEGSGASTEICYFDAWQLNEITKREYDQGAAQCLTNYPYR